MSEESSLMTKPRKIWNDALKVVKGEDSAQLIESFTAEMTLVAEGLCEDQNKLRGEVSQMMNEEDRRLQRQESRVQELEVRLEEQEKEHDRVVTDLRNRLAALEKQASRDNRAAEKARRERKERNRIREITILICVAAVAAVAVILVWKLV